MKSKHLALLLFSVLLTSAGVGLTQTTNLITFDNLGDGTCTNPITISSGYGNSHFTWDNFYVLDGVDYCDNPSGFEYGVVSGTSVAFNGGGNTATISSSKPFLLLSADLTAAWFDDLEVEVQGYVSGSLAYDDTYFLSSTSPTLITFGYAGVTEVDFISSGGTTNTAYSGSGEQFAMDNLTVVTYSNALAVTLEPSGAVNAGAQWSIDGVNWRSSGDNLYNLTPNKYTVQFSSLSGWASPSNQTVTVTSSTTTNVTGTYTQLGSLKVNLTPQAAVTAGALWSIDNINWQDTGTTLSNLAPGRYTVEFSPVASYNTPTNQSATVKGGAVTTVTGAYTQTSWLQVTLNPDAAVTAGALWQLDGGSWQSNGVTATVAMGYHTVAFKALVGWQTPTNQTCWCAANTTQSIAGLYQAIGSLKVNLSPSAAVTAGARWQWDNGSWLTNGATVTNLLTGLYTINFNSLTGWATPASFPVTIAQDTTTSTNATYGELTNQLEIETTGWGEISPNYSNAWLQIGYSYSLTSSPAAGYKFTGWTISTNWIGGVTTNNRALHFQMASNLTLLASFVATNKPSVTITTPAAKQRMTNAIAAVRGTAGDLLGVAGVWYSLNSAAWNLAATTNSWTNWNATLTLTAGTNTITAYGQNLAGNYSSTSSVSIYSSNTFQLRLLLASPAALGTDGLTFTLELSSNLNGYIEYSTNLENWVSWTNFKGTTSAIQMRDPAATNSSDRFYRAVIP